MRRRCARSWVCILPWLVALACNDTTRSQIGQDGQTVSYSDTQLEDSDSTPDDTHVGTPQATLDAASDSEPADPSAQRGWKPEYCNKIIPCDADSTCPAGTYCLPYSMGWRCTPTCLSDCGEACPALYGQCAVLDGGAEPIIACSNPDVWFPQGAPCASDVDCRLEFLPTEVGRSMFRCAQVPASGTPSFRQCLRRCVADSVCDATETCLPQSSPSPGSASVCTPKSGHVPCGMWAVKSSVQGPCDRANVHGLCKGSSHCSTVGALPTCDAPEPASETCGPAGTGDGIDQDCDGETDEGCAP